MNRRRDYDARASFIASRQDKPSEVELAWATIIKALCGNIGVQNSIIVYFFPGAIPHTDLFTVIVQRSLFNSFILHR